MKTLFLFSTASGYGGAEKSLEAVLPALTRAFRVVVFAENPAHLRALAKACASEKDARVLRLAGGMHPGVLAKNIAAVRDEWRRTPPHVLLSNTNKGALWVSMCQRFASRPIPTFLFVRDFGWQLRPLIFSMQREWEAIVPSPSVPASDYWRHWLAGAKIHVIPNAVAGPPRGDGTTAARPGGRPYVLCLANLSRWKGIDLLLRAFAQAAAPDLRLIVQGKSTDRKYRNELDRLVLTLGLSGRVEFREFADDVSTLYAGSACVAVSSISAHGGPESFGRTVIEAWAHGKPVIAFDCGGPKYLIRDGSDGFLVPEGDFRAFADKLRLLALEVRLARELGEAGCRRAMTEFSVEAVATALVHALNGGEQNTQSAMEIPGRAP